MGLGSALSTAVSGLNVNQNALDVIGNNLANTNTTAYKAFRNEFVSNFYNTQGLGSAPTNNNAGANPTQIGQGSRIGAVAVDFRPGAPTQTGLPSDLYIQGTGFFVVNRGAESFYTRDGAFRLNSASELVNAQGMRVQGFGVDQDFNIQPGSLVDLTVPIGSLQIAKATDNAFFEGTLNTSGDVATTGTTLRTGPLLDGGVPATAASQLQNITSDGQPLIDGGFPASITYTPRRGGRVLPPVTVTLQATDTLGDLANFIVGSLGIDTSLAGSPGFIVNAAGELSVTGNFGALNDFNIDGGDFSFPGGTLNLDFLNRDATANGESSITEFVAFDSLGSKIRVQAVAYLESLSTESSTFRLVFSSPDQSIDPTVGDPYNRSLGSAQLTFDENGQLRTVTGNTLTIQRDLTGAGDPLSFQLNVDGVTALSVDSSQLAVVSQDGSPPGTLIDFGIDANGVIVGAFDNGLTRSLGQIALARFANPSGLVAQDGNLFTQGPNSGLAFVTQPGNGVGTILSGSLELGNVDIAVSFVQLLTASTAFSANSRVIATTQELFQTLLSLPRT